MPLKYFLKLSLSLISLVISSSLARAEIALTPGSYVNRTHIDTFAGQVNLNFTYRGCDPNPSADKIKLETDGKCKDPARMRLRQQGDETAINGHVGQIKVSYQEPNIACDSNNRWSAKPLHTNQSFADLYKKFQAKGCFPSHIVLTNENSQGVQQISKALKKPELCRLPKTRVRKAGFPTENDKHFPLTANDKGFQIGKTKYWYNHDKQNWCAEYNGEKKCTDSDGNATTCCGEWGSPLPLAYHDTGDKRFHLKGTVTLGPGPRASIRAIDKTYRSQAALFEDQKRGGFTQTDTKKGRIDFQTWRNDNNRLVRSIVRSYETDEDNAIHERSLNFFARNVLGESVTKSWCSDEHCFIEPPSNPRLDPLLCKDGGTEKGCFKACPASPQISLNNGGNLNACSSCLGITPGECAIKSKANGTEFGGIPLLRANITENENLSLNPMTGEPRLKNNVQAGMAHLYAQIIQSTPNPGCFQGNAMSHPIMFEPQFVEPERSTQSVKKKK